MPWKQSSVMDEKLRFIADWLSGEEPRAVLCARYDHEVPVLFIDGRKAFKYRATVVDLIRKLKRKRRPFLTRVARLTGKDSP